MAGASRYDLIEKAGLKHARHVRRAGGDAEGGQRQGRGRRPVMAENHYGWTFIPFLQGFGGNVFRNPPDDLMPVLDTPEAVAAADFFCQPAAQLRSGRRAVLHLRPGGGRR